MANNQTKHQRFDWKKFREDIARGAKPIISSLAFDDLRRLMMQIEYHFASKYSEESLQVSENSFWVEASSGSALKAGPGDLEVSVFDTSHGVGHIEMSEDVPVVTAGRWMRWKNTDYMYDDQIWCDGLYESGNTYYEGEIRFYLGSLFQVVNESGTSQAPITLVKTVPNVQYSAVHADWTRVCEVVPCCYYNETTERLESKIHYDTWVKGTEYAQNDCVSWQGGYKAKNAIVNADLEPCNNLDEWEKLNTEWNTSTGDFELAPSNNYLHDWSKNFPGTARFYDKQIESGVIEVENIIECHPSLFFPTQVDPAEQYEHIIAAYKEQALTNLSGQRNTLFAKDNIFKVPINHLHITDADYMGAVFKANRWSSHETLASGWVYEKIDGLGILAGFGKTFDGNQYRNYGGDIKNNSPYDIGDWTKNNKIKGAMQQHADCILSDAALRLPADAIFRANWRWKNFVHPPSPPDTPIVNSVYYIGTYPTGSLQRYIGEDQWQTVQDEEISYWDSHPSVCDDCWGENEAGIELFLKKLNRFDWMFQFNDDKHYIPDEICQYAEKTTHGEGSNGQTPWPDDADTCLENWGCNTGKGTWRRIDQYTLKRKPFIRSQEMGEPAHRKDAFEPAAYSFGGHDFTVPPIYIDNPERWWGAFTKDIPKINDFDNEFETITPLLVQGIAWQANQPYKKWTIVNNSGISYFALQDVTDVTNAPASNAQYQKLKIHTISFTGNRKNNANADENIKAGWMLHLFDMDGEDYPEISTDNTLMKSPYVLSVNYDSVQDLTFILLSESVNTGTNDEGTYFSVIGWNKNVSDRHDGIGANWHYDETTRDIIYKIQYYCHPQLLLDMYDLLNLSNYKSLQNPAIEKKGLSIAGFANEKASDSLGGALATAKGMATSQIGRVNDPDTWPTSQIYWQSPDAPEGAAYGYRVEQHIGAAPAILDVDKDVNETSITYVWNGGLGIWDVTISANANYDAAAFKITNWGLELKGLPKEIMIKFILSGIYKGDPQTQFSQTAGDLSNNLLDEVASKFYYSYGKGTVGGDWHVITPTLGWDAYLKTVDEQLDDYDTHGESYQGSSPLGLYDIVTTSPVVIIIDFEDVPEDFYVDNFYHVDAPRVLQLDDKPPETPAHHYEPYGFLDYVLPYDLEDPDDVDEWVSGSSYSTDDKVFQMINGFRQLFTAKNSIVNTTIPPINNPDEWTWEEPYVEVRFKAESTICKDHEASYPVKYRLLCSDESYNTAYATPREKNILLETVAVPISNITEIGNTDYVDFDPVYWASNDYPEGTIVRDNMKFYERTSAPKIGSKPSDGYADWTEADVDIKIYHDGQIAIDDVVEILGTPFDGVHTAIDAGSGWIIINIDMMKYVGSTTTGKIINRTQTYTAADWETNYDVQGVPDNETVLSRWAAVTEPADYIDYFDE